MPDPSNSRAWQLDALIHTARIATPLQSELGQCFISVPLQTEAHQIIPLHSNAFHNWLLEKFYSEHQVMPRASVIRDVIRLLEAKTQFGGVPRASIACRLASAPGKVILDLYNDQGEIVEISAQGWHITQNLSANFRSTRSARPLPHPEKSAGFDKLQAALQLSPEHFTHCLSWLTSAMSPTGPYPILVVQGAGKSSVAKLLRSLIDPGPTSFCPAPISSRELQSLASHNWILALDQIEQLPSRMLRQLIRLSTGQTFAARDRASDPEPFHVFLERPILLTTSAALSPELAACAITINAPVEVGEYQHLRPQILGALCNAVTASLASGKATAIPVNNSIANALAAFMQDQTEWTGTATELLTNLRAANPSIEWPATAKGLSQLLSRTALRPVTFQAVQNTADGRRRIQLIKTATLVKDAQARGLSALHAFSATPKRHTTSRARPTATPSRPTKMSNTSARLTTAPHSAILPHSK